MLLFFISLMFVFFTSFFFVSVINSKKFYLSIIYFLLIAFTNIVLTFEVLSIFSAISRIGVLLLNILFFIISVICWYKFGKPHLKISLKSSVKRFLNTLIKDKYLLFLTLCSLFMCVVSLWLISFMPVVNPDAEGYHVLRSLFWISNHNLNHFSISEARCLDLPINSEILYAWVLLFIQKCVWFGMFSFLGFVLVVASLWGILSNIGFSIRRRLWVILITSSFASVIVQISGTETDIIISGLVLSSILLYWNSLKNGKKFPLFMSSLAYALAIGTKTPSIMLIPGVGVWMIAMSFYYRKKEFYKPFLLFLGFGVINFILFAAYNYILNFVDYGNIAGSASFLSAHRNHYGFKSVAADYIKYLFMFFDFTGFTWNQTLGVKLIHFRDELISNLGLFVSFDGLNSSDSSVSNNTLLEPLMGMGILGFIVYLPCLLYSLVKPLFSRRRKDWILFLFAMILVITIFVMAFQLQYMTYSIRFLTSFCVVSAPVLAYSYCRKNNFIKFIIVFFAIFYLLFVSTNLWARAATRIFSYFRHGATVSQVREIATCSGFFKNIEKNPSLMYNYPVFNIACGIRDKIKMLDKRNKILYFSNASDTLLIIKMLEFSGYDIDFDVAENIENIDLNKYNLIMTIDDLQISTNVLKYEERNSDNEYITDGIVCSYIDLNDMPIKSVSKNYPYKSICRFTDYFYKKHGFKYYNEFAVDYTENGKTTVMTYRFYENKNNPVINPLH